MQNPIVFDRGSMSTCIPTISKYAIKAIQQLKRNHIYKDIVVVALLDPWIMKIDGRDEDSQLKIDGYPENAVDQIVYAPVFDGVCEQYPERFCSTDQR